MFFRASGGGPVSALLIQGGRLFDPALGLDAVGDLLIVGERIAAVGKAGAAESVEVIEAAGLWVLPGLMDIHVHLREPGQEQKETIATGTRAAAAGGFVAVACEPNTVPPRDTPERLAEVLAIAGRQAVARVMPKCAITVGQEGKELTDFSALRRAGAVAASDDGFSVREESVMREAMAAAKRAGLPLTVHVDELEMVERDIALAAELDCAVHFSHVSLAGEVEIIARARLRGLPVTGEATPHHLSLCAEEAPEGDPNFKTNPPLRSPRDRAALRRALAVGVISVIASDHAPHAPEEKAQPYQEAPPGVIGLETTVGVIWSDLVHAGRLEAAAAVRAMTVGPAKVLGIEACALREGVRADVTLLDPDHEWVVEPTRFESKARNCPFARRRLRGKVVATIVEGRVVMREGSLLAAGGAE